MALFEIVIEELTSYDVSTIVMFYGVISIIYVVFGFIWCRNMGIEMRVY